MTHGSLMKVKSIAESSPWSILQKVSEYTQELSKSHNADQPMAP